MTLPRKPAAVVFDMDGLLFDTEVLYRDSFDLAAAEGGHPMPKDFFLQLIGLPVGHGRIRLRAHFGDGFPFDEFDAAWSRHFERLVATGLSLKQGVTEILEALDRLALPRAIATSSARPTVDAHLSTHGLTRHFPVIVARGDYAAGKPAPDPFLAAAQRLGVAPQSCLALEDSYNGVKSASAAGMMTVMVPDLLPPTDEIRSLCTFVARDLHEVRTRLLAAIDRAT